MNRIPKSIALLLAALCTAVVFGADCFFTTQSSNVGDSIAVLYITAICLAYVAGRRFTWAVAAVCCLLTIGVSFLSPASDQLWPLFFSRTVSIVAIAVTTLLTIRLDQIRSRAAAEQNVGSIASGSGDCEHQRPIDSQNKADEVQVVREQLRLEREKRAASEERTRLTFESSLDAVMTVDQDGMIIDWNTQAEHTFGWPRDEAIGQALSTLILPPHQRDAHRKRLQHFRDMDPSHASNQRLEITAIRKDGEEFPIEIGIVPLKMAEGLHLCAFVRDISLRRKAEIDRQQRSARTRDRLELALTNANVGLWDWNAQTDEVYYSPTYKAQLGYPPEVEWNHFDDWKNRLHPDDEKAALKKVTDYFAHAMDEYQSTFRQRCQDGSYRWFLAQGTAEFDEHDAPIRMVGVHVDVTDQVESERELSRLNAALEIANEALQHSNVELQQFAYVASHDLQTPLRAIAGFAQFLHKDYHGQLDEKADDYINRIVGGVKRMQKLINDLLAYSRVESRATPFKPTCLNSVFEDAVSLLEASIKDTGAQVTRDELPTIWGDRSQLSQLLQNLIGNAIKYHREDPQIHVSAQQRDGNWIIAVEDNGIGIQPKHCERIFEIFKRLHTGEAYPGTGIGLAVCRRIATKHQGKIWVESVEGQGSTFFVSIPQRMVEPK